MMADFLLLAMKEEVILDEESSEHPHQLGSNKSEVNSESPLRQPMKTESPESASTPLEGVNEGLYEVQSGTSQAGHSGQGEAPEPRTEAQGARQEDDGRSQSGTERTFRCNVCPKSFKRKAYLDDHVKIHTGEKPFSCDTCGASFFRKLSLQTHAHTHTGKTPYVCETCGKGFTSRNHLNQHSRVHTGKRPFKCDSCGRCFVHKSALAKHAYLHTGAKPFGCRTCGARFARKSALRVHLGVHTGDRPYRCERCGQAFARKEHLQNHAYVHTGERPFGCETCGKHFVRKAKLRMHILKGHEHPQRKVQISPGAAGGSGRQEGRRAPSIEALGTEQQVNVQSQTQGECTFSCDVCHKSFARKNKLIVHQRVHRAKKSSSCEICGRGYSSKSYLEIHRRYHTGERPYMCEMCGESFVCKSNLLRHIDNHAQERSYACETCGRCFSQKHSLDGHVRIHTREKLRQQKMQSRSSGAGSSVQEERQEPRTVEPQGECSIGFTCVVCQESFVGKDQLIVHLRIHTGGEAYKCNICTRSFSKQHHLNRHVKAHARLKDWLLKVQNSMSHAGSSEQEKGQQPRTEVSAVEQGSTVSVKEEEEECLAQPELVLCTNYGDDAEESMEEQEADPLSTVEIKKEEDIECIKMEVPAEEFNCLSVFKLERE